jgi:hypothetical protein
METGTSRDSSRGRELQLAIEAYLVEQGWEKLAAANSYYWRDARNKTFNIHWADAFETAVRRELEALCRVGLAGGQV